VLRKFAVFEVMGAWRVPQGASSRSLARMAHRVSFDYQVRPGFLYVRSRMISSRCNDNWDEFPAEEITKAHQTFLGKPVFVNHHNANHRRARGVIIRVALHEDTNRDGTPDTWVEGLMEVDAVRFPKLAQAILAGRIDRTSMGVDVDFSKCSACGNIAADVADYCQHIPAQKGRRHVRYEASGERRPEFIRETCYGLRFFENSLLVEEPADPTAVFTGVDASGLKATAAGRRTAAPADEPDFRDHLGNHCLGCGDRVKWGKHPTKGGWRHYSPAREYDHAPMPSDPDDKSRPMQAVYGGTDCLICHEPAKISLDHLKTPTGGWSHHDGMKRDHPAIPSDARRVYDAIPGIKARQQQANQDMADRMHTQFEQMSGHPLPRRERGDEASMPPDPFTAERHRTAATAPHPRTSEELAAHLDRDHRLEPHELAGNDHWDLHHEEHSGGWPEEDHTHEPFYHGTSLGSDEDWPSHVRPAGAGHLYPGEHDGDHAFAISDPESAWDYAEKAYGANRGDQPRVLRVRPTGPFEEDSMYAGDTLRSPGSGSVRSRHPWAVTGEEDIPEHHQRGYEDGTDRTGSLQAEAAGPRYPDPADHPWFQAHPVSHLHVVHAFHDSTSGERASGASWYKDAHHVAKAVAGGNAALGAGVLSAYSPRTFWPANMFHASRSLREGRAIGPGEGVNAMRMHQAPAQRMIDGEHWRDVLKGPKTRAFAHLIEHGGESDDDKANNTGPAVIDRHAMSVAVGHRLSDDDMAGMPLDHPHYYGHVVKQYQHAAADLSEHYGRHIAPHEVQATTWLRQVRRNTDEMKGSDERLDKGRITRQRNDQGRWNETAREHHPSVQHLFEGRLWPGRQAAVRRQRLAYGETRVPPEVDTLRDEECPVCGERDVYSGQRCPVCGFVSPPQMFKDPDLEKAKQMDLRQDQAGTPAGDPTGVGGGTTIPQEGLQQPGQEMAGQAPDAQQGSFPDADNQLDHPDQLAPDGVPGAEQGAADSPGQPGGPTLDCPVCGFVVPAAGAVTQTTTPEQPAAMGFSEGDPCPNCGQGQLMSSDDMQMAEGLPPGEQANAGQGGLPSEGDAMAQGFGAPGLGQGQPLGGDPEGMPVSPEDSAAILGQQPVMPGPGGELPPGADPEQGEEFPEEQQASEDDAEQEQEQEDEEAAEEEEGGAPVDDEDDPMNRRSKQSSREGSRMTSALEAALDAQQRQLAQVLAQNRQLLGQQRQILGQNTALRAQLRLVGSLAGIEPEMAAIEQRVASRLRTADMNNPASPVPDPPEQPAPESTEQALQPDAMDDPRRPGLTPGSVSNVPAMQTTTPLRPGVEDQTPPATNLIDVTAPVQGTNPAQDGGVPLQQRRIETDVRVGDPMNPQIAFPWTLGPDQQDSMTGPQDTGQSGGGQAPQRQAAASREDLARARMMGSMRLARLRVQAGSARGDEMTLAGQIEADAALSTPMIEHEIATLTGLGVGRPRQAQAQRQAPRTAATRAVPSMSSAPRPVMASASAPYAGEEDLAGDADLFM
jgi:hypothetical protein